MTGTVDVLLVVLVSFGIGHHVGDILLQTHGQATRKGRRDRAGQWACLNHVASLTTAKAVAFILVTMCTGMTAFPPAAVVALVAAFVADAAAHYWIDRRFTLAALVTRASRVIPGKDEFYELGDGAAAPCGTGAYAIDQVAHYVVMFLAALLVSAVALVAGA